MPGMAALFLLLVLSGASPALTAAPPASLEHWLQQRLLPDISQRLSRHPRFKGQAIQVVGIRDNTLLAEMDGLTGYIRQRLIDRLQAETRVRLIQPLPGKPWRHDSRSDTDCPPRNRAQIQITIEVGDAATAGFTRVSVQAIDLVENRWISGFKQVWVGMLSAEDQKKRRRRVVDQSMKGSRQLPFAGDEPDRLAAYLAHTIHCRLNDRGRRDLVLYIDAPGQGAPAYFHKVSHLIGQYLAEYRRLRMSTERDEANAVLAIGTHPIDGQLYQVWADLRQGGSATTGLDVPAYVRLSAAQLAPPPSLVEPRLIAAFQLIVPRQQTLCRSPDPWAKGGIALKQDAHLPSGGCFAVHYQAARASTLYLFGQSADGRVTRLLPDPCNALQLNLQAGQLTEGEQLHIPGLDQRRSGYFVIDDQAGREWIYALAVTDDETQAQVARQLGTVNALCTPARDAGGRSVEAFQATLKQLAESNPDTLEWRAISFHHDPP